MLTESVEKSIVHKYFQTLFVKYENLIWEVADSFGLCWIFIVSRLEVSVD